MTGDVRQQLTEALDEAERQAKACGVDVTWSVEHRDDWTGDGTKLEPACVSGDCDCSVIVGSNGMRIYDEGGHDSADAAFIARWDPATVLRLVGYFRVELIEIGIELADDPTDETATWRLQRAAAFWLGTPEGGEG